MFCSVFHGMCKDENIFHLFMALELTLKIDFIRNIEKLIIERVSTNSRSIRSAIPTRVSIEPAHNTVENMREKYEEKYLYIRIKKVFSFVFFT